MAEEIEKELDIEVELKPGELHSFDVYIDEELIFSKFKENRFPEAVEIIAAINTYLDRK
ncbi:MAG: Rdx family protein [Spirochaetaceae bacterium]|nr:MAG: Rdx family protein [Spirochaetaceae bacterium]